ncbi:(4Fe-4S)-binding protein [Streptomyces sp. b94]|nr:(4Fe-4S)-binding protein [Streptomyces sp. b94]
MTSAGQASGAGRTSAERDRCVGAGRCVLTAPTVFDQAEEEGLCTGRDGAVAATTVRPGVSVPRHGEGACSCAQLSSKP